MRVGFEPTPRRTRYAEQKLPWSLVWRLRPLGHLTMLSMSNLCRCYMIPDQSTDSRTRILHIFFPVMLVGILPFYLATYAPALKSSASVFSITRPSTARLLPPLKESELFGVVALATLQEQMWSHQVLTPTRPLSSPTSPFALVRRSMFQRRGVRIR